MADGSSGLRRSGASNRWPLVSSERWGPENREAAVGVQVFHVRQRWGAAIWRAQTQVLLGRLKCALPGWRGRVETCGGHSGGGQLPVARLWVWCSRLRRRQLGCRVRRRRGSRRPVRRRLGRWGVAVAPAVSAWTPRARGAREGRARGGFLGGALRSGSESPSPPKKKIVRNPETRTICLLKLKFRLDN
jgi:hypothetical protein